MTWACHVSPKHHDRTTLTYKLRNNLHDTPQRPQTPQQHHPTAQHLHNNPQHTRNTHNTPHNTHTPAYTRARARPISRARALPTNRHEGGSLT